MALKSPLLVIVDACKHGPICCWSVVNNTYFDPSSLPSHNNGATHRHNFDFRYACFNPSGGWVAYSQGVHPYKKIAQLSGHELLSNMVVEMPMYWRYMSSLCSNYIINYSRNYLNIAVRYKEGLLHGFNCQRRSFKDPRYISIVWCHLSNSHARIVIIHTLGCIWFSIAAFDMPRSSVEYTME